MFRTSTDGLNPLDISQTVFLFSSFSQVWFQPVVCPHQIISLFHWKKRGSCDSEGCTTVSFHYTIVNGCNQHVGVTLFLFYLHHRLLLQSVYSNCIFFVCLRFFFGFFSSVSLVLSFIVSIRSKIFVLILFFTFSLFEMSMGFVRAHTSKNYKNSAVYFHLFVFLPFIQCLVSMCGFFSSSEE